MTSAAVDASMHPAVDPDDHTQDALLTLQAAADTLDVSRDFLTRLLDRGEIPFRRVGASRRVVAAELLAYKARRDASRRQSLRTLTQLSEELGLYEPQI